MAMIYGAHTAHGDGIVVLVERIGQHFNERNVCPRLPGTRHGGRVTLQDLFTAGEERREGFARGPGVLPTAHGPATEVGVAIHAGVAQDFAFNCNGAVEQFRMSFSKADPLGLALVEAESSNPSVFSNRSRPADQSRRR